MNRLFEDATDRRARAGDGDEIETADWHPVADVYDTEEAYLIAVDLPGVERSALEIDFDEQKLVIRGTRTIEKSGDKGKERVNRPYGRFRRSFTVPPNVAHDGIQAEYRDGVLEITLPKRNETRGQRIQIKVQ
ncbi:MAG: Hsp20/alpha crystallin family protein [Pyrinomonadaceae bacterium]